ncbi:uncharacterized protein Tco025E_09428 [Trypanosoma conorhini]|uniref:Mucin TcMUCII n=1 Tax=Trypanosoma conorhini TaxID=83891 RepID=A0A422MWF3_9TRYP|nr:uncharacterized protein Tco025E_09428 [Trypanosoma conorhini]RNE97565.1 hypothetical protein Tco025E_09428 [Trypanosoma conorhini]
MRRPRRTAPLLPLALLLLLLLCAAAGCLAEAPAKVAQGGDASQDGVTSGTPKDPSSEDNQLSGGNTLPGSGAGTEKGPEEADTAKTPESPDLSGTDGQEPALPPAPAPQADNKAVLPTAGAESEETRRGVDAGSLSTKAKGRRRGKRPRSRKQPRRSSSSGQGRRTA